MAKVANDSPLAGVMAEARGLAGQRQLWIALLGAGLVIGIAGPFGTYDTMRLPARTVYWLGVVPTTYWLGYLSSFALTSWAEARGLGARPSLVFGALAASLAVTLWLALLHMVVFAAPFLAEGLRLLPYVAVIALTIAILTEARDARAAQAAAPARVPEPEPAWLDRLPPDLGRDLILLQAQDHYLRAQTALGETLIRARIQDATEALGPYGLRIHRSWWVARHAIAACRYRDGAPVIVLQDGAMLPIGRTYRRAVREALRQA